MSRFVIDASVVLAWCFEDERTPYTEGILDRLVADGEALVPAVWPAEVANALLSAERRKRITPAQTTGFLNRLTGFDIRVIPAEMTRSFDRILPVAREHGLTTYDAAYLELALRETLPLATLDAALKKAARSVGVPIFGPRSGG